MASPGYPLPDRSSAWRRFSHLYERRDVRRSLMVLIHFAILLSSTIWLSAPATGQEVVDLRESRLPIWDLHEQFRLGSVNGAHDAFGRPVELKVDDRGRLYVLDEGLPGLLIFDARGTFIRQIGRKGEGPGEYTMPVTFGFLGDTIWIADFARKRVALFEPDGRVLEDFALEPEVSGMEPPLPIDVLGSNDFLVVVPPGPDRFFRGYGMGPVSFRQSVIRRNRSGTVADTLVTYRVEAGFIVTRSDAEGFGVVPYQPISQLPLFQVNARRGEITEVQRPVAVQSDVGEFRVTVRRLDGAVVADRRFRYRPIRMPESVKDSLKEDMRSKFKKAPADQMKVALKYLDVPDFLPPVSNHGVALGKDGTRWISREQFPGVTSQQRYLVTDSALHPLASFKVPPGSLRLIGPVTRDRVWLLEEDELGVQYLVRYGLRRE